MADTSPNINEKLADCWLSTIDNPFDPFSDFNQWFYFDESAGYCCCERVDNEAEINNTMSDVEIAIEMERAIDEIIMNDPAAIFIKVYRKGVGPNDEDASQT